MLSEESKENVLIEISNSFDLNNHPFLSKIKYADKTNNNLGKKFSPFFFGVDTWLYILEKFSSKLLDNGFKLQEKLIRENINDEMGYVKENNVIDPNKNHKISYINFIHALGFCGKIEINSSVKKWNSDLDYVVTTKEPAYIAAVLGGIEHLFMSLSNFISENIKPYLIFEQEHFINHEIIDEKHSDDFFKVSIDLKISQEDFKESVKLGYQILWDAFDFDN